MFYNELYWLLSGLVDISSIHKANLFNLENVCQPIGCIGRFAKAMVSIDSEYVDSKQSCKRSSNFDWFHGLTFQKRNYILIAHAIIWRPSRWPLLPQVSVVYPSSPTLTSRRSPDPYFRLGPVSRPRRSTRYITAGVLRQKILSAAGGRPGHWRGHQDFSPFSATNKIVPSRGKDYCSRSLLMEITLQYSREMTTGLRVLHDSLGEMKAILWLGWQ